jgi:hypothetical protein
MNTELGAGWAYFVDHRNFARELDRVKGAKQQEVLYLSHHARTYIIADAEDT